MARKNQGTLLSAQVDDNDDDDGWNSEFPLLSNKLPYQS